VTLGPHLPGYELIEKGLVELRSGSLSMEALLIALSAPRLRRLGLALPPQNELPDEPELRLYRLLRQEFPADAYSRYNALLRRLISFEHALERGT
jgi:hypothetical protein